MCNIGLLDKIIRIIIGSFVGLLAFFSLKIYLAIIAILLLGTGFTGFCPIYKLLNFNTGCKKIDAEDEL